MVRAAAGDPWGRVTRRDVACAVRENQKLPSREGLLVRKVAVDPWPHPQPALQLWPPH